MSAADEARDRIRGWLQEAVDLRGNLGMDAYDDLSNPYQVVEQLSRVRATLDRIEELLVLATRAKASLTRAHRTTKDEQQLAWDQHVTSQSALKRPVLTQEYVTGKEKFAEANLATLELQRAERKSLEVLSFAEEALDVIRIIHRGLEGIRQDLLAQIRAIQVESQLER